jgi:hypothetical protein
MDYLSVDWVGPDFICHKVVVTRCPAPQVNGKWLENRSK